jgi:glycosyltransferase involved in cell wall biosynthesis
MTPVVLACVRQKVPHVLVVHETWKPDNLRYYLEELWKIDQVSAEDVILGLESAQKVIFPARYLAGTYGELVEPRRAENIYCTIDFEGIAAYRAANPRGTIRKLFGLTHDTCLFIQVGTVTRRKAQVSTLRAFGRLLQQVPELPAKLFFIGARSFRPGERGYISELQSIIVSNDLTSRVSVFEVRDDVYPFYLAADVLVHPSINEVLPLAILEACAFRVPPIVSNLDGIPEVVRNEIEGLLVDPFDLNSITAAMLWLAQDEDLRKRLGERAWERVKSQHSDVRFAGNYCRLINNLLCFDENIGSNDDFLIG